MYKTETNEKIGEYVGNLISRKYGADRKFAIKYLKIRDEIPEEPPADEIQKMSNRICQIKQGKKGIQITDLPIFAHLLDVSVDAILSGGKELKLASTRMTNYSVAHSSDESVWKEYVEHPDKLILNCDEYGKSVIDYALEIKNYRFLKYLMDNGLIWFVDDTQQGYWGSFGAGTSIQRRYPGDTDNLDIMMKQNDSLRTSLVALSLENGDLDVLEGMKAREVPVMYEARCFLRTPLDFEKYYNAQLMDAILKSDDKVLDYYSKEFEIKANDGFVFTCVFPFLGKLIGMAVKKGHKSIKVMLVNAIKHNRNTLDKIRKIAMIRAKVMTENMSYLNKTDIAKIVMEDYHFYETNDTVCFHTGLISTKDLQGLFTNIIRVNVSSKDTGIKVLIDELNETYDLIKNYMYKESVNE